MPTIIYKWLSKIRDSLAATVYNNPSEQKQQKTLYQLCVITDMIPKKNGIQLSAKRQ